MRTLQEKYNGIQEGKFSKEHFLAEARMQQPQLITRFNGYDDAVQILKNKGMIQEAVKENAIKAHMEKLIQAAKTGNKTKESILAGFAGADIKYKVTNAEPNVIKYWNDEQGLEGEIKLKEPVKEARMQQPQLITRFNGYDDAVQILKNKGMIQEIASFAERFKEYSNDALTDMIINLSRYQGNEKEIEEVKAELARRKENINEAKQTKLTKKSLTDYRYKPTNDMDKYPYEQILRGIRVELEVLGVHGTPTAEEYSKALAKVSKNLEKDSIFYTNQVAGVNPKVDLHDKMVPVTAKNTVDTFNGMKKAALKEGFKNLIKKVLTEDSETSSRAIQHGQPSEEEYEFYSDPENYKDAEEEFELQGEEDLDESATGEIYQIAQEYDRFEDFVQAVEQEFGPVEDIAELEYIFNSTRKEDDIQFDDENFSDPMIDGEDDLYETRKAKSLSQLLK